MMDMTADRRHYPAMRPVPILLLLLCLSACSGDPGAYGITGPAPPTPPVPMEDSRAGTPGVPEPASAISPSIYPTTGNGRFWGYN
jgi:hypothetical protein